MASGRLILPITEPLLSASGAPVVGATLTINDAGTGTPSDLFAEASLSTPIANPQTSDAAGRFYDQTTVIWADNSIAYDATVSFPTGETLTYEDIYVLGAATNVSGFAPIDSPHFTGVPVAPTPALNDSSGKIATTDYVKGQAYAPLASPTFTGVPAAPTATAGTNTTQIATTAFVRTAITGGASSAYFQSANVTITTPSNGSFAHGLGVNPTRVQAVLVCTSAINGYAIGDMIPVNYIHDQAGEHGPVVWAVNDSTTVKYQLPSSTILLLNTSGAAFNATSANFVMVVRAWA